MCGCMKPNCAIHRISAYMYVCVLWPIVKLAKHYRVMLMMNRPKILRIIFLLSKWIWLMCFEIFMTLYIYLMNRWSLPDAMIISNWNWMWFIRRKTIHRISFVEKCIRCKKGIIHLILVFWWSLDDLQLRCTAI